MTPGVQVLYLIKTFDLQCTKYDKEQTRKNALEIQHYFSGFIFNFQQHQRLFHLSFDTIIHISIGTKRSERTQTILTIQTEFVAI